MRTTFLMIVAAIVLYLIWPYFAKTTHQPEGKAITVSVVKITRSNLTEKLTLSAELVPYQKATLYAKVSGYLKTINVDIGDQVKAGQTLAVLEVPELKDDLADSKARYDEAKLEYDRISAVPKNHPGLIAQEDVDKARATYEMAQAKFEHAKTLLKYSIITAPYDGIITQRFVDEGALIQTGTSSSTQAHPVVEVAENTKLRLVFPVPESVVMQVNPGDKAEITIQATGETLVGTISRSADKVDTNTRTMQTEVDLDNTNLKMKPGMYAAVTLLLHQKKDALAVPIQAVELGDKPNVWIVNAQGKLEQRPVKISLQTPDFVGITSGVEEGEQVVFGSRDLLKQGMKAIPTVIDVPQVRE